MDIKHQLGRGKLGLETGMLVQQTGVLVVEGVTRLGGPARDGLLLRGQAAAVALGAPRGHMRAVQTMAAEQLTAAGVTTGQALVLRKDGELLGGGEAVLRWPSLGEWALTQGDTAGAATEG